MNSMTRLLEFLNELRQRNIHFTLEHDCDDAVMVVIAVPGERWEVQFFTDNHVEVQVFRSLGITGEEELARLFREFSD